MEQKSPVLSKGRGICLVVPPNVYRKVHTFLPFRVHFLVWPSIGNFFYRIL